MIPPELQWCHQIAVTSVCWPKTPSGQKTQCSNCTRLLGHERRNYVMTPWQFEMCAYAAAEFVHDSPPDVQGRTKTIGIFGGEPLMSPHFPAYVEILCHYVPDARHRGLWTSVDWPNYVSATYGAAAPLVRRLLGMEGDSIRPRRGCGYLNWNDHADAKEVTHQPLLVAISDVVKDERRRWELISDCWVNREWSAAYALDRAGTPKFYFCEVASAFDRVLGLDIGLPVERGCWRGPLTLAPDAAGVLRPTGKFASQVLAACGRCGAALPMTGRRDAEQVDDISPLNLEALRAVGSPMVARGDYVDHTHANEITAAQWQPSVYIKGNG